MWGMKRKKRKAARHDSIVQEKTPYLWPNQSGTLNTGGHRRARSSGLLLQHLPPSPHGVVGKVSRLLRSRSFSSWLGSRSLGVGGFGMARESLFEMWLLAQLAICDYGGLLIEEVVRNAAADLAIEPDEVFRLVIRATRETGRFRVDDGLITLRR